MESQKLDFTVTCGEAEASFVFELTPKIAVRVEIDNGSLMMLSFCCHKHLAGCGAMLGMSEEVYCEACRKPSSLSYAQAFFYWGSSSQESDLARWAESVLNLFLDPLEAALRTYLFTDRIMRAREGAEAIRYSYPEEFISWDLAKRRQWWISTAKAKAKELNASAKALL